MRIYGALSEAFTRSGWCVYHEKPPLIIQSCIGDYVENVPLFNGQLWHELQCKVSHFVLVESVNKTIEFRVVVHDAG